ncbi:sulfatase-like hydrolase/transferase [Aureliella helgolandensis]|uniref:Extracellular exo-alpha-(1->5)-L-arabinofuranosidase n=1 Tax=Aureliella helgolandensis TaxID=2527968 RepID=A0A518G8G6_9BACT|nr:sulfatase-like hydrolase/transferase [Aureliella helgolandensis]QDV24880.1 Extracellular exo-alpha-(1->5)-L-arabinofuranosidase precursor [Aureliella helgolandensis]
MPSNQNLCKCWKSIAPIFLLAFCQLVGPVWLLASSPDLAGAGERPHIVFFLSDDHTLTDSSLYGASDIATPNMERIATAGMTFSQAFVISPSCAPSRAALLTGMTPAHNGAEANHSRPHARLKKFPAYLQEQGYEVVAFGKVGHYVQTPEYGFDLAKHFTYHDDVAVAEAVKWLENRRNDKPLCLFVGTNWPHVPWPTATDVPLDSVKIPQNHVRTPETRRARAKYYQAIQIMDGELGSVFDAAYRKLGENTLFIHSSDHGAQWPFGKWNLYDAGIRTPLVATWPGKIAAGSKSDALVSWIDLLPTVLDAVGAAVPASLDGQSILPVLTGHKSKHRSEIYTTHSGDGNFNVYPARSVRDERFKYIRNLYPEFQFDSHVTKVSKEDAYWSSWVEKARTVPAAARKVRRYQQRPAEELYDLTTDPDEEHNLAQQPEQLDRLRSMREKLDVWLQEQEDRPTVFGMPTLLPQARTPPNVITVLIDDMGWQDLSCFGGQDVETKHLDRLAEEGLRFTNFYVNSPICSSSRTALTTGNFPARHRITSYLARRELNESRGMAQWLDAGVATLPRMVSEAGYATGHFGKWHMGGQRDVGDAPLITEYGFDASLTNFEGLGPRILPLCDAFDGTEPKRHDLGSAKLGRGPIEWQDRSTITQRFVDRALEFIDESVAQQQPFYINVWPDDVHSPFFPPQALRGDGAKRTLYLAVLKTMDQQLGALFDRVRNDPLLRENTLIVVASDNGHEPGAGSGGPLRGEKGSLYEGGIRSPLIVWGPGLVEAAAAGTTNNTTTASSVDLVASLMNLCHVKTPVGYQCDGEDLLAALLGKTSAQRTGPLFWRRPPDRPGTAKHPAPDLAIRDKQWKLLCDVEGQHPQLYDLSTDVAEAEDVSKAHPQIVKRLTKAVLAWNGALPVDGVGAAQQIGGLPLRQFINPIAEGADPSVVWDGERYLWATSHGNRAVSVWSSPTLTSLGTQHSIWQAPESGPFSQEVWAPELLRIGDRWYVYVAASDGENRNHLQYVLESETSDPLSNYTLHGPLYTGDDFDAQENNIWAIDMTVLQQRDQLFAIWSGWSDATSDRQLLYIAPMKSPTEVAGPRVQLCNPDDFLWERVEETAASRGLHEGPQVLQRAGRTFVVYSCGASWLPTYKLGMLELTGDNPLDPADWHKFPKPVFESTDRTYGVGHGSFVPSPDQSQWWHVYHAKRDREPGWRRAIFVQPLDWDEQGLPRFGTPVPSNTPLAIPAGTLVPPLKTQRKIDFGSATVAGLFDTYAHHQFVSWEEGAGVHLGRVPEQPVNTYRAGEKLTLRVGVYKDVELTAKFSFVSGDRDAGVLFRVSGPSVGYDAQRGYFAGLVPRRGTVVLGKTDGVRWHHLADAPVEIDWTQDQQLRIRALKNRIEIFVNGATEPSLSVNDGTYPTGTVGIRVVDTHAIFKSLQVLPRNQKSLTPQQ